MAVLEFTPFINRTAHSHHRVKTLKLISTLSVIAGSVLVAKANPIPLYNTGVDNAGNILANNAPEMHYSLVSNPGGTSSLRVAADSNGYPVYVWDGSGATSNSLSEWIGPASDSQLDGPVGYYDYRVTFSLAGLLANTASISGRLATDDQGTNILINGISTGFTAGFATNWTGFTISNPADFVAGTNTLDFIVFNSGGPTGLRVEMTGTADASGVPDGGATVAMLGIALTGIAALRRRFSRA